MLKFVPIISEPYRCNDGVPIDLGRGRFAGYHIPTPYNFGAHHHGGGNSNTVLAHHASSSLIGGPGASAGASGPTRSQSSPLTQAFWTIFWLAMLIFVAYPAGIIAGQLYVVLSPLSASRCLRKPLEPLCATLLQALHLPLIAIENMATAKPLIFI